MEALREVCVISRDDLVDACLEDAVLRKGDRGVDLVMWRAAEVLFGDDGGDGNDDPPTSSIVSPNDKLNSGGVGVAVFIFAGSFYL